MSIDEILFINYEQLNGFIKSYLDMNNLNILPEDVRWYYDYESHVLLWSMEMWECMLWFVDNGDMSSFSYLMKSIITYELNKSVIFLNTASYDLVEYQTFYESSKNKLNIMFYEYMLMDSKFVLYDGLLKQLNKKDSISIILESYKKEVNRIRENCVKNSSELSELINTLFHQNRFINGLLQTTDDYINLNIVLSSLELPIYVLLWILEWLSPIVDLFTQTIDYKQWFHILPEFNKIRIIENVANFRKSILKKPLLI